MVSSLAAVQRKLILKDTYNLREAERCLNPYNRKAENTHFVWDQLVLECNGSVPNYIPESIKFVYCSLVEGLLRVQSLMVMIGCYGLCGSPYDPFSHTHTLSNSCS